MREGGWSERLRGASGRWRAVGQLALALGAALSIGSCTRRDTGEADGHSTTRASALAADPATIVSALKARPGSPIGASVATGFDAVSGGVKPRFGASDLAAEPAPARVTFPAQASAAVQLEDAATGTAIDVTLRGATAVAGQPTDGYVVYAGATATGGNVVHRALAAGLEDFITFDTRPAATQVAYDLALRPGASGLRLVANSLEVLGSDGTPRLRVAPPFIVGADGVVTDATIAVAGCAVDTDPAPPWGRAVIAPGAATCRVNVTWPRSGVAYPALLDPRWTTTASMGTARQDHTMTLLSNGKVLVTGGRSTTGTTGLSSAELYDRTSGTWAATGSFTGGRFLHRATQLNTSGNATTSGKVLLSGGINGTTSVATAQLYSPSAGTWIAAGNLNAARHGHAATLLADGKVLIAGGLNGTATLATAAIYNPASGAGSWAATTGPLPPTGQKNHTAVLLQTPNQQLNNKVLLVGGNSGSATLSVVYLFDPAQSAFSTLASMPAARELHTMTRLSDGKVLVTGGKSGSTTLNTTAIFDPGFGPGSWSTAGTMTAARWGHTATLLPASIVANGQVLVAGGSSGSTALSSAELFSGTSTWTATPAMPAAVQGHTAVLLGDNMVLTCGGLNGSTVQSAARLYDASFGLGCSSASQCPSGFCVNGICCGSACNGGCGACNLAGSLGTCTARASGTTCRASAGACDPAETCNGSSLNCPADALSGSTTVCRGAADECDQAETCTGSSPACSADAKKPNGTACTDDGNACTTDTCNGTSVACQHPAGNAGAQCRAAAGDCDLAESCPGSSATCPADAKKPNGTACTDDGNVCTNDTCNGSSVACQHPAGNGGTLCRVAAGECDLGESCTGSSATCPADAKKPNGTACADDGNVCTADTCNGSSVTCQHPAGNAGTQCRAAVADCDLPATCTGSSATCPANPFKPSSTVCRAAADVCDAAESCTGASAACPANAFASASTVCRATAGICDVAENCTGSGAACPGDTFASPSTVCRAAAGQCDVAETCTGGGATCPADALAANGTACNDSDACTQTDSCQAGTCAGSNAVTCTAQDQCHDVGTCNPATGACTNPTAVDGTPCSDDSACTQTDTCQAGGCVGYDPVVCVASDTCHGPGACEPATGICSDPSQPCPPIVDAGGGAITVQLPAAAALAGSITQDPPQGALTVSWTQVDGPGLATFANPTSAATTVTFTNPGVYTLRLIGSDSVRSASDDVVVTVLPAASSGVAAGGESPVPGETFINLERTAGHIGLRNQSGAFQFIWVAVSTKGTIVKLDTVTGQILGEYWTSPDFQPRDPSRTTVDHNGNVWTANRAGNSVVHVGLQENGQCVDRNGNGVIDTSLGLNDIKAWTNSGGADNNGGVSTAADECILHYTKVRNPGTRHIAVDANNDVWVSGWQSDSTSVPRYFDLIDGQTGLVKREEPAIGYGGYGGLIDGNGVIWSARPLMRWDPQNPLTGGPEGPNWRGYSHASYGLCIDRQGNVWNTWFDSPQIRKFNPAGDEVGLFGHGAGNAQGCAVDGNGHVWVTHSLFGSDVGHLRPDGTWIGNVSTPGGPTGVAVDAAGKIWAAAYGQGVVYRIDPSAGPLGTDGVTPVGAVDFTSPNLGGNPYNYSDMTGSTLIGAPLNGTWSFVWDSGQDVAEWGKLGWTAAITGDGALTVRAASSTDGVAFSPPVVVRRGEDFDVPHGRYLRVTVTFKRSSTGESPLLYDLTIGTAAFPLPPQTNHPPAVSAGPDRSITLPSPLTILGQVQDDGLPAGALDVTWIDLGTGTLPVLFTFPNAPKTDVGFSAPGVYDLRLFASDLELTATDDVQVVVDTGPPLTEATFVVNRAPASPLNIASTVIITASLVDSSAQPMQQYPVRFQVAGANPADVTFLTGTDGIARFQYVGAAVGIDNVTVTAMGLATSLVETLPPFEWQPAGSVPITLTQNWIGTPLNQAAVQGQVEVKLAAGVTLVSGVVDYAPARDLNDIRVLNPSAVGGPGATVATLDTTLLPNDGYVIRLSGIDNQGQQQTSLILVNVTGDYKPGRVVVEFTDLKIDLPGLPITIGRRYDSLEKDIVGDFGHGWSLAIGHPRLEVNPDFGVSLTLPDGRRARFGLSIVDPINDPDVPNFFGVYAPVYYAEPGVFGTLTHEGACPLVRYNPGNPENPIPCFLTGAVGIFKFAPDFYTYTDPYGTAHRMAASGELKSIKDRQGNTLTFTPEGIISSAGKSVTFERDGQNRITKVISPVVGPGQPPVETHYAYDPAGDLVTIELPPNDGSAVAHHTYNQHRLLTTTDPRGKPARTSTYDPISGRLASDTDAVGNTTSYAYDLETRTTTTTHPDTGTVTQVFDARGLLLSETNPLGRTTTRVYDANRKEISRTNAAGEVTTSIYDPRGNQTSVTTPLTAPLPTNATIYDAFNLPTSITDALGQTTTITYDDRHVPKSFTDALGTRFSFTNSDQGVPLTIEDAAGKQARLVYDGAGNVISRSDFLGGVTQSTYDELGRLLTQTSPRGGVETKTYFPRGTVHVATDALGNTRTYTYDANDNIVTEVLAGPSGSGFAPRTTTRVYNALNQLTQVTNPDGTTVGYTRDFRGNPLTMTDEAGRTTSYEYDLTGNLIKTTFPDDDALPGNNPFTSRTYDELNRLATTTDERGKATTYAYQTGCGCSDRVTTVTDPLGRATVTTYDALGRRTSVTDAASRQTAFAYDVRGHLTETFYPDGTSTQQGYDPRGRRISMTDQSSLATLYGYDDQGQLTSVTDPLGNVTRYAYDLDGNLASIVDANRHTTTYEYDLLKRKTKRTLPRGQSETFAHDSAGNQVAHTDFRGKITAMTYDARDRTLTKAPDPSLGEPAQSYTYSLTGMRLTATKAGDTTSYTYDARDRTLTKAAAAGTLTYTYDAAGNLATIRSSNANGTSVDYAWDAASQLTSITDNRAGGATVPAWGPTGRLSALAQPNGIGVTYGYDTLDRVTSMTWRQGTAPPFASWAYAYSVRGQRLSATDITQRRASYGYDGAMRLTSEAITSDPRGPTHNGAIAYLLDPAGNRLSRISTLAAVASASYTYNANDQLGGDGYDSNGNTTSSDSHTYAYDFENRLVSKDGGAVTIAYDCDGNRVTKTIGGVTTRYLVDDLNPTGYLQVLEEVIGGVVQTRYTYGTNIVSQTRNVSSTPARSYYGYDAHGNITFLTDANGAVTDSYDYDAWGILVASTGSTPNSHLYTGEEFDLDLGLINLRARQYRPGTGRFLTSDPATGYGMDPISFNRFLYAAADPANRTDPLGLMAAEGGVLRWGVTAPLLTPAEILTIKTAAVYVAGIAVACGLVRASGISPKEMLMAAAVTANPMLAALAVCAKTFECTLTGAGADAEGSYCIYQCGRQGNKYFYTDAPELCPKFKSSGEFGIGGPLN